METFKKAPAFNESELNFFFKRDEELRRDHNNEDGVLYTALQLNGGGHGMHASDYERDATSSALERRLSTISLSTTVNERTHHEQTFSPRDTTYADRSASTLSVYTDARSSIQFNHPDLPPVDEKSRSSQSRERPPRPRPSQPSRTPGYSFWSLASALKNGRSSSLSMKTASSHASFRSARSTRTDYSSATLQLHRATSSTAKRVPRAREEEPPETTMPPQLRKLKTEYDKVLREESIVQPFDQELNWSGKGQHVTFLPKDEVPLKFLSHLGASETARVEKVLCRRIALARKTMRCTRQFTVADALSEVRHLQGLQHFHIVQLVGSYLQGRQFCLLMYPAADCHLGKFLEDVVDDVYVGHAWKSFLSSSLVCLASAVAYIHEHTIKHMDIKPQNILVRVVTTTTPLEWRVYIADFGLSRSFAAQDHSQTEGPTSRTPRYCAPEVFQYKQRGRSADVFSLGCVFLEMLTVYLHKHPQDFADFRRGDGSDESFHGNLVRVKEWISDTLRPGVDASVHHKCSIFPSPEEVRNALTIVKTMIDNDPGQRMTALQVQMALEQRRNQNILLALRCCTRQPELYVAHEPQPS